MVADGGEGNACTCIPAKKNCWLEGKLIVRATDDAKFQHKVEMVNLVLGGMTPSALSEYVRESKNTITLWVKTADEKGFDALRVKKQPGRPTRLSAENIAAIKAVLAEDAPKKYGCHVWDGPSLSAYIAREYGVSLGVRQCQRMFHSLGFSLIRPHPQPKAGTPKKSGRRFKKERKS